MAVNLKLSVRPDGLEIARVLGLSGDESVNLESQVPIGWGTVPFVRVRNVDPEAFETAIRRHPGVESIERFSREADEDLFAVDCRLEDDPFFEAVDAAGGYLLGAAGGPARWRFRLRFSDRAALAKFDSELGDAAVPYELLAVYHDTPPSAQPLFGLTRPQREALVAAVEAGYFDIPRDVTTSELADEFAISIRRSSSGCAARFRTSRRTRSCPGRSSDGGCLGDRFAWQAMPAPTDSREWL